MSINSIAQIVQTSNETVPTIHNDRILYVGGSGPGNYSTIQGAIEDANDSDTVFVYDDSSPYLEEIVIRTSINLIGEDKNTTIIDGGYQIIKIYKDSVMVKNFTIINGREGIRIEYHNNIIISNNIFGNNYQDISIVKGNNILIQNNILTGNQNCYFGFWVWGQNISIVGNKILGYYGECIVINTEGNNYIKNNIIDCLSSSYSIYLIESHNNYISGNTINVHGGTSGIINSCLYIKGNSNNVQNNTFANSSQPHSVGIRIYGNDNIFSHNNITNNTNGIILVGDNNHITNNNFLKNGHNAFFYLFSKSNQWKYNYWNQTRSLPYVIIGRLYLSIIPWVNFDWHPAKEPYNIPGIK
jgi:hypothetical protein